MISIITRDELAHIMNGETTISRRLFIKFQFNITWITTKVYTVQIITGSYILSTTSTFSSRKFIVHS